MAKRVLDVGNCGPDHASIRQLFQQRFGCEVDRADQAADALEKLRSRTFDLVVVNRKLDIDYTDGVEVIRQIKADPALAAVPVMLITNYAEHQAEAVAAGALRGFGKLEFGEPETIQRIQAALG